VLVVCLIDPKKERLIIQHLKVSLNIPS
jgi:hypothetical protein